MKLNQLINENLIWDAITNAHQNWDVTYQENLLAILTMLSLNHGERPVRPNFDTAEKLQKYLTGWIRINQQRLTYLLQTISSEFIQTTNTNTVNVENTNFNVDYFGGVGQTDRQSNDKTFKTEWIDAKIKLSNFDNIMNNLIFHDLFNKICEVWFESEF